MKAAVNARLDNDFELEARYWVAQKLRPDGFYCYFFGQDADFCDHIDSHWLVLYHTLNRPFLKHNPVTVTNL